MQRDPVKRNVSHVDFMQIDLSKEIVMSVPIRLTGTAKAVVQEGGLVDPAVDRVEIRAAANNIPNELVIDVTDMNMHSIIRMEDIVLPKGVTAVSDPDLVVVTVLVTSSQVDKPVAAAAGEAVAGEAPVAGAPAAGDKPAAS
jgi:large subunit ribosomal protein L25